MTTRQHIVVNLFLLGDLILINLNSFYELIYFWSLPVGILTPILCLLSFFLSLWAWKNSKEHLYSIMAVLWIFIPLADFNLSTPEKSGVPVISWNIGAPDKSKFDCILSTLEEWQESNPDGLMFFQEIRHDLAMKVEQNLDIQCRWKTYFASCKSNTCNGLQICIPNEWTFSKTGHRDFSQRGTYGFLQTELNHLPTSRTINALNIHLESLYLTKWRDQNKSSSLSILHKNTLHQTEQVQQLLNIFDQLQDPIILAGDFNSVSPMWIHRKLRQGFTDAHRATGFAFGWTKFKFHFPLRIDFLYAKAPLKWTGPTLNRNDITCSDHFPVQSWFNWVEN